jgi:hypothetical protein
MNILLAIIGLLLAGQFATLALMIIGFVLYFRGKYGSA